MSARLGRERANDRRTGGALDADHPGPIGTDQSQCLQLVERLGHADDAGSAPGRIDDHVGQLPTALVQAFAGRLGHLESEGLLPLGAPTGLLKSGDAEIALREVLLADPLAAVDDRARDQLQLDAVRVEPGQGGHLAQYRQVGVGRHHDSRLDLRRDGILGQRITGIPLSRHRQAVQAEDSGHRDRHRHASILERQGGVPPKARVGSPFILDFQSAAQAIGHWVRDRLDSACTPRRG